MPEEIGEGLQPPPEEITVTVAPSGSMASDEALVVSSSLLSVCSDAVKSNLLALSNIGSATTTKIQNALEVVQAFDVQSANLIDETVLNGLANGAETSAIVVNNIGDSSFVKIILVLDEITPTAIAPKVVVYSGASGYSLSLSTISSAKRLEFLNIPASFVASFKVINQTGVSFPASKNSILVVGQ